MEPFSGPAPAMVRMAVRKESEISNRSRNGWGGGKLTLHDTTETLAGNHTSSEREGDLLVLAGPALAPPDRQESGGSHSSSVLSLGQNESQSRSRRV